MSRGTFSGSSVGAPVSVSLAVKAPTKWATTAALAANTYASGPQTLTANANGALSIDGNSPAVNDRVLVKNEVTTSNNGWYVVTATGSVSAKYVLTRSTDANSSSLIAGGDYSWNEQGTANAATSWVMNNETFATLDTDAITFVAFSLGIVLAGDVTGPGNANTVATISGSSGTATIAAAAMTWGASVAAPTLNQAQRTDNAAGQPMTIAAQASKVGSGAAGGNVTIKGGAGDGAGATGGVNLNAGATTLLDVGVTTSSTATLGAGVSLAGAAGAGAVSLGLMTGNTALPTGNLSWTAAATKTGSLVAAGAFTITAGAASTWGSSVDNAVTIGTSTNRLVAVNSIAFNVWGASLDANAAVTLSSSAGGGQVLIGPGGATGADVRLQRTALKTLTIDDTAGNGVTLRFAAASTITAAAGLLTLSGVGGTTVQGGAAGVNVNITTTGAGSNIFTSGNANFFAGAPVLPQVDLGITIGTSTFRWASVNAAAYNLFANVSDPNAVVALNSSGQVVLRTSSAGNPYTISPVNPGASRTYTIQDIGAAATFVTVAASVAVSGGSTATLGGITGGPSGTAQTHWAKFVDQGGTTRWLSVWT